MIQGYPDRSSVFPGDTLTLRISTDAPQFRVDFYQQGQALEVKQTSGWLAGQHFPSGPPDQDWNWPAYTFPVPHEWTSGAYIAMFVQGDAHGNPINPPDPNTADGRDAKALFVVKHANPGSGASILYKLALLTYQAYNKEGGRSIGTPPYAVTIHRPGGGTGGKLDGDWNVDPFDPTPRNTFVHWDAPFIAWLEKNGYQVGYCTDLDIHDDAHLELLSSYSLLLCVGHDGYWSEAMRSHVQMFVENGGNVGCFSGSGCYWHIEFDDALTFRRTAPWWYATVQGGPNEPENSLTGVSFRNGGERDLNDHPGPVGYQVQHADHWVYQGTGLKGGEVFGGGQNEYIVGYECDGAEFDRSDFNNGAPVGPTGNDGTPSNFVILGIGDAGAHNWGIGNGAATMGLYTNNGTVFTAATTDWARVLGRLHEPRVEQITRNVLNTLSGSAPTPRKDAPMFGFNPQRTHCNPYESVLSPATVSGLKESWSALTQSSILSSPAVVNGRVYVGSLDKSLYAFDVSTGKQSWAYPTGGQIWSSPAVVDGVVYVGSDDHNLYALDATTGSLKWLYPTRDAIQSSPVVANNIVYVGSFDHQLYAFEVSTGAKVWSHQTQASIYSSPAIAYGVVYIGSEDHTLYALDAATGLPKWSYMTGWKIDSSPAVANGIVYIASFDKMLYALDAARGLLKWSYAIGDFTFGSSPAVAYGIVYMASNDGKLYALDALTGTLKWIFRIHDTTLWIRSSPTVANGIVYLGSAGGTLYALHALTGTVLKEIGPSNKYNYFSSSPAVANGVVYIGNGNYYLYAFHLSDTSSSSLGMEATTPLRNSP